MGVGLGRKVGDGEGLLVGEGEGERVGDGVGDRVGEGVGAGDGHNVVLFIGSVAQSPGTVQAVFELWVTKARQ